MSTNETSHLSYRTLIDRIRADESLPAGKREDVASGLRSFTKVVGLPVDTRVPPLPELRKLITRFTPAMTNMSPGRWRNIRGHLQFALAHAEVASVPRRYQIRPSPRWAELLKPLEYGTRYKLSHIARYCTATGIEPGQVDDEVMNRLLQDLRERSLKAEPNRVHRDAAIAWNKEANRNPDWPQQTLKVADNRPYYCIPWERFPESLRADIDHWLARLSGSSLRLPMKVKPLRPASIKTRKRQLHEYVSALVLEGIDPSTLLTLREIVTPELAKKGMMFFWNRAGERSSVHAGQIVGLLLSIARHHAKLDESALQELRELRKCVAIDQTGMTERNRARLIALDDPDRVEDLVLLPGLLTDEVRRQGKPTRTLAIQMQTAVAIEILLLFPIRLKNLRHLRVDKHLIFGRRPADITIVIPPDEVKNSVPLEARLPESAGKLINLYLTAYRPLLDNPDSYWLFPGQKPGTPKHDGTLRVQVKDMLWKRCGLDFRPHTFRHAAGKIILDGNPGSYAQVQRLLGHKRLNTTMQFYTGMESKAALAHYDAQIMRLRGEAGGGRRRKGLAR
jgi:integrase